jgi:antitoxin (DNA-binding transcriptional repressor) of toxin-antitoxin stability system
MKTASIRQVRNTFPEILSWVEQGEEVLVLNRKTPVARICPLREHPAAKVTMPDFQDRSSRILKGRTLQTSQHLLEEREASRW